MQNSKVKTYSIIVEKQRVFIDSENAKRITSTLADPEAKRVIIPGKGIYPKHEIGALKTLTSAEQRIANKPKKIFKMIGRPKDQFDIALENAYRVCSLFFDSDVEERENAYDSIIEEHGLNNTNIQMMRIIHEKENAEIGLGRFHGNRIKEIETPLKDYFINYK